MNMISCKNNYGQLGILPKEKFKFRPSVYGIIRHADKICICKLKSNGKIWFTGGGIDPGETREAALLREIDEETGLKNITVGRLLGSFENFFCYQPEDWAMHAFLFFYECHAHDTVFRENDKLDDEYDFQWIDANRIKKEELADLNEEIFNLLSIYAHRD